MVFPLRVICWAYIGGIIGYMYTKTLADCFIMHFHLLAGDIYTCVLLCCCLVPGCKSGVDIYWWHIYWYILLDGVSPVAGCSRGVNWGMRGSVTNLLQPAYKSPTNPTQIGKFVRFVGSPRRQIAGICLPLGSWRLTLQPHLLPTPLVPCELRCVKTLGIKFSSTIWYDSSNAHYKDSEWVSTRIT